MVRVGDIRVPSRIILLVDSNGDKNYDCLANAVPVQYYPGDRHLEGGNMIHVDGAAVRYDAPEDISASPGVDFWGQLAEHKQLMWGHYGLIYD